MGCVDSTAPVLPRSGRRRRLIVLDVLQIGGRIEGGRRRRRRRVRQPFGTQPLAGPAAEAPQRSGHHQVEHDAADDDHREHRVYGDDARIEGHLPDVRTGVRRLRGTGVAEALHQQRLGGLAGGLARGAGDFRIRFHGDGVAGVDVDLGRVEEPVGVL